MVLEKNAENPMEGKGKKKLRFSGELTLKNQYGTHEFKKKAWIGNLIKNSLWMSTNYGGKKIEGKPGRGKG